MFKSLKLQSGEDICKSDFHVIISKEPKMHYKDIDLNLSILEQVYIIKISNLMSLVVKLIKYIICEA